MSIADILTRIAGKISKVFDAGKKAGRDAEWSEFWDAYQDGGYKTGWNYAFYGSHWNDTNFKPKYDITFSSNMNNYTDVFRGSYITDLKGILERQGRSLDTSGCSGTNSIALFNQCSKLAHVPILNVSNAPSGVGSLFNGCKDLQYVEKLILSENGTKFSNTTFTNCNALEEIRFEGKIASDINFGDCSSLSNDSTDSIINALSDTTTGLTCTIYLTSYLANNWDELIARKPNWRFASA